MRLKVPMQVQPTVDVQLTGDDDKALVREMIYLFSWAIEIPYWTRQWQPFPGNPSSLSSSTAVSNVSTMAHYPGDHALGLALDQPALAGCPRLG